MSASQKLAILWPYLVIIGLWAVAFAGWCIFAYGGDENRPQPHSD